MKKSPLTTFTLATLLAIAPFIASAEDGNGFRNRLLHRVDTMEAGLGALLHKDTDANASVDVRSDTEVSKRDVSTRFGAAVMVKADADKDDDNDEDKNKKEHIFSLPPGIEKRLENGKDLPKGIAQKLFDNDDGDKKDKDDHGTSTPKDTTAPFIFVIRTATGTSTASVSWLTNERATSSITYGTTTALGSTAPIEMTGGFRHKAILSGLTSDTLYYYAIVATDAAGNTRQSATASFKTDAVGTPADTTAPSVVFSIAAHVTADSARLIWVTNEETRGSVLLGTTTVSTSFPLIKKNELSFFHEARVSGLIKGTAYVATLVSIDAAGNRTESSLSFTTKTD